MTETSDRPARLSSAPLSHISHLCEEGRHSHRDRLTWASGIATLRYAVVALRSTVQQASPSSLSSCSALRCTADAKRTTRSPGDFATSLNFRLLEAGLRGEPRTLYSADVCGVGVTERRSLLCSSFASSFYIQTRRDRDKPFLETLLVKLDASPSLVYARQRRFE